MWRRQPLPQLRLCLFHFLSRLPRCQRLHRPPPSLSLPSQFAAPQGLAGAPPAPSPPLPLQPQPVFAGSASLNSGSATNTLPCASNSPAKVADATERDRMRVPKRPPAALQRLPVQWLRLTQLALLLQQQRRQWRQPPQIHTPRSPWRCPGSPNCVNLELLGGG